MHVPLRPPARGRPLREIETWVFDLDNTLYPPTARVYREVEQRMNEFIMAELKIELDAAQALRKRFFEAHGTTLRGLMNEYGLAPKHFLDYVHELDLTPLPRDAALAAALAALPGRKLIFTNGRGAMPSACWRISASAKRSAPSTTSRRATMCRSRTRAAIARCSTGTASMPRAPR